MVEGKAFDGGEIQGEKVRGDRKDVHLVGTHIQIRWRKNREEAEDGKGDLRESQDPACQKYTRVMLPPI